MFNPEPYLGQERTIGEYPLPQSAGVVVIQIDRGAYDVLRLGGPILWGVLNSPHSIIHSERLTVGGSQLVDPLMEYEHVFLLLIRQIIELQATHQDLIHRDHSLQLGVSRPQQVAADKEEMDVCSRRDQHLTSVGDVKHKSIEPNGRSRGA